VDCYYDVEELRAYNRPGLLLKWVRQCYASEAAAERGVVREPV
jgi:hypothetical protein